MRPIKIALVILALWSVALTILTVSLFLSQRRNRQSFESFSEFLEFRRLELPAPVDTKYEWHFQLRDYKEPSAVPNGSDDWMDPRRKVTVAFMPTGQNEIYRFWLANVNGTSSGETRLDVCDDPDNTLKKCDFGQLDYNWYKEPMRIEDGKSFVICDIREVLGLQRRKQLVFYLGLYRLEDIQRDLDQKSHDKKSSTNFD